MPHSPSRPEADEFADFYARYVETAEEPLLDALEADAGAWSRLLAEVPPDREGYRYAPGKWSVREVVGHVIDAERTFAVRAMAFARGDRSHFPSFDENAYAANSGADARALPALAEELEAVRRSTVLLLRSFDGEAWNLRGVASGCEFTVRSLAWIIAGHSRHHRKVLKDRYLGAGRPA